MVGELQALCRVLGALAAPGGWGEKVHRRVIAFATVNSYFHGSRMNHLVTARVAMSSITLAAILLAAGLSLHAAAPKVTTAPGRQRATEMEDFIQLYTTDRSSVGRFYDLPWSEVRHERTGKLLAEWRGKLEAVNFDRLDQPGRIDYLLLRNEIESERSRLALEQRRLAEMSALLPFRQTIQTLEQSRWRMEPLDPRKAAGQIAALPEQIKQVRKRIEKGKGKKDDAKKTEEPLTPALSPSDGASEKTRGSDSLAPAEGERAGARGNSSDKNDSPGLEKERKKDEEPIKVSPALARRAAQAVSEIRGTFKGWVSFYDGFVPEFSWWMKKPGDETLTALEDYAKFLREEIAGLKGKDEDPLIGDAIGAEALAEDIKSEMLPYTAEELLAIGEAEFAWCQARMKDAAREMGLGDDWKAALAKVKDDLTPPGKQDAVVLDEARQAIQFVKEKDLVTVPPLAEEIWRMTMIQPEAQKTMPYAAYSGPNMLVAYAKDEMKHEDKLMSMRGNNRFFMRIVTPHELIPGHHLQQFMAARHRQYRGLFYTPFYVEGWSLYWEIRLWDLKYGRTPEERVGMLFWRMHRCARIIVSLKFHLGRMTPAEMVDFIVDRVGHERFGATSEVRRFIAGGYSPLYQAGYMIGGLQLRALREEMVAKGKMTDKQFNDEVLKSGPIPIEFIRAAMLNVPLKRDMKASWKFAGEKP